MLLGAKADPAPATTPAEAAAPRSTSKRGAAPSALRVATKYGHDSIVKLITEHQLGAVLGGFSASGAMLPLSGVPFDAASQRFYFSPGVFADLEPAHFAWGTGDFTLTATITPRADGKVTAKGEYAVLFIKSSDTQDPFMGPSCIIYNSGLVQFRLARTPEL